ncbi:MAG: type II toxin-antitoxin system RelE/ParE family toxin [Acidimicrobiia bacterium]|nr:type II toxin-antitoxin system RelE/ParE family toxin [Acidimicrobiia bacterium]MYC57209.1 type II toxin-antitoxin system RelE/ParE family toxin [Acidimicrobiia bacterium]MYG93864.1 type II toxin-antitoxin system RelE/ParE family toxin [Acidimicrobiia bacterium]MYI29867.1 type II toxin-antitoxin system RelE/ParE family toxin [Acidimicrobiia bacterium]
MAAYSVRIKRSAIRDLAGIPRQDLERIEYAIDRLAVQAYSGHPLKGDLRGLRRLRVGDYRVVYEVLKSELVVLVIRVAHRREVYRRR